MPYLLWFLGISVAFELFIGKYFKEMVGSNTVSNNIYVVPCVVYYLYVFTHNQKKLIWIVASAVFLLTVGFEIYMHQLTRIMTIAYNAGMLMVVWFIFQYLYDKVILNPFLDLLRIPEFWMAIGILLFYSSSFPILLFANRLMDAEYQLATKLLGLLPIGNIFLTLGYLMTVLCQIPIKIYSTSLR